MRLPRMLALWPGAWLPGPLPSLRKPDAGMMVEVAAASTVALLNREGFPHRVNPHLGGCLPSVEGPYACLFSKASSDGGPTPASAHFICLVMPAQTFPQVTRTVAFLVKNKQQNQPSCC